MTRFRAILTSLFLTLFAVSLWAGTGIIGGTLKNEWGDPLIGATVRIPNQNHLAIVGHRSGGYELKGVPAGVYDVLYEHAAYNSLLLRNVVVEEGVVTELHVVLSLAGNGAGVVDTVILESASDTAEIEPDSLGIEER